MELHPTPLPIPPILWYSIPSKIGLFPIPFLAHCSSFSRPLALSVAVAVGPRRSPASRPLGRHLLLCLSPSRWPVSRSPVARPLARSVATSLPLALSVACVSVACRSPSRPLGRHLLLCLLPSRWPSVAPSSRLPCARSVAVFWSIFSYIHLRISTAPVSRMEFSQNSQGGKGKNKRFWTKQEELGLIQGLLELSSDPQWKAEGSFRGGYLLKLEAMLKEKCPGSGLKASPHIDSKTKWFRDKYNAISEMLRTSGFAWDDTTKIVQCERQSYDDFVKRNKNAKGLWGQPFPYFDELDKIFSADRATGAAVEDFVDAVQELGNEVHDVDFAEPMTEEDDNDDGVESANDVRSSSQGSKRSRNEKRTTEIVKRRKPTEVVDLTTTIANVASQFSGFVDGMNTHLAAIASSFSTAQAHEQLLMDRELELRNRERDLEEKRNGLFNEVSSIPGLTRVETITAVNKLAANDRSLSMFYQCPNEEWKKEFILILLRPHLAP